MPDNRLTKADREAIRHARQAAADPLVRHAQDLIASAGAAVRHAQDLASEALRNGAETIASLLGRVDWQLLLQTIDDYQALVPSNLTLQAVVAAALSDNEDGIPVAWVPRTEIVEALLLQDGNSDDRVDLLLDRTDDILDDCDAALSANPTAAAREVLHAVAALRAGHVGPAQSHGSNLVDSIVLHVFSDAPRRRVGNARADATRRAVEPLPAGAIAVTAVVERIVLGPLVQGLGRWWPDRPVPARGFNRHVTSHAAHRDGVFSDFNALVVVMLATSLATHYEEELA